MPPDPDLSEAQEAVYRRYKEAREYGLTKIEARMFAESSIDVGELRRLQQKGCPPKLAADILL